MRRLHSMDWFVRIVAFAIVVSFVVAVARIAWRSAVVELTSFARPRLFYPIQQWNSSQTASRHVTKYNPNRNHHESTLQHHGQTYHLLEALLRILMHPTFLLMFGISEELVLAKGPIDANTRPEGEHQGLPRAVPNNGRIPKQQLSR